MQLSAVEHSCIVYRSRTTHGPSGVKAASSPRTRWKGHLPKYFHGLKPVEARKDSWACMQWYAQSSCMPHTSCHCAIMQKPRMHGRKAQVRTSQDHRVSPRMKSGCGPHICRGHRPYVEDFSVEITVAHPVLLHADMHVLKSGLVSPGEATHRMGNSTRSSSRAAKAAIEPGFQVISHTTHPTTALLK